MRKNDSLNGKEAMQSLLNKLPNFFFILDERHRIIFFNKSVSEMLGSSVEQLQNAEITSLICKTKQQEFLNLIKQSTNEQDSIAEIDFQTVDGECIPTDTHVSQGIWNDKAAIFVISINQKDKLQLIETTERERKAYAIIAEATVATDSIADLCHTIITGLVETLEYDIGAVRIFDEVKNVLRLEAVVGIELENIASEVAMDDPNLLVSYVALTKEPIFASDVLESPETLLQKKRISQLGLKSIAFWPLKDGQGNLLGVCNIGSRTCKKLLEDDRAFFETVAGMFGTVLDRRITTIRLKASQDQFFAFADHIPGPVYIKDHESRLIFANSFMTEPSSKSDWIGKDNYFLFPDRALAEKITREDKRVLREGLLTKVTRRRMSSGSPGFFRTIKFPIHLEGSPPLLGGVSIDITEQRIAEQKMVEEKARAEFFTDLMSHDLNNLHQGIMSSLELLLISDHVSGEAIDMVNQALSQVQRSVTLIGNVRRFSFLQNQPLELHSRDLHIDVVNAIDAVTESFPEKNINVEINFASDQFTVNADEFLFDVLYNLIHNSAKYDLNDPVHILVNTSLSDDEKSVKLELEDRGPGIPDDLKNTILTKLEDKKERQKGIGLTLVFQIIERYKGKIQVEDRIAKDPTKGTKFTLLLPHYINEIDSTD